MFPRPVILVLLSTLAHASLGRSCDVVRQKGGNAIAVVSEQPNPGGRAILGSGEEARDVNEVNDVAEEEPREEKRGSQESEAETPWSEDPQHVHEALLDYFENLPFRRGWRQAALERGTVSPLLLLCAHSIAWIRASLDREHGPGVRIRVLDGGARDYMMTWQANPDTPESQRDFVRGIIWHAFLDGEGLVEGLSTLRLNELRRAAIVFALTVEGVATQLNRETVALLQASEVSVG
jgi:hypothetical protein